MKWCIVDKKTRTRWKRRKFATQREARAKCAQLNRLRGNRGRYTATRCR